MKKIIIFILIITCPLFLTGCSSNVCLKETKVKKVTVIKSGLFGKITYLIEYEDGSFGDTDSTIYITPKCLEYKKL